MLLNDTVPVRSDTVECETPSCSNPATCRGIYEGEGPERAACDECCGHGNEDGYCNPLGARSDELDRIMSELGSGDVDRKPAELNPCPRPECPGLGHICRRPRKPLSDREPFIIRCNRCFVSGPAMDTRELAIAQWNMLSMTSGSDDERALACLAGDAPTADVMTIQERQTGVSLAVTWHPNEPTR
jgi:hypothetical protein